MPTRAKHSDRALPSPSINPSDWLLKALTGSEIGFAVYDEGFHYVGVNSAISAMNGVPPEEHLGQTPPDVIGRTSRIIEPQIDRVFMTGQPVYRHEFCAKLPMRTDIGHWIQDYFPIGDERDRVSHVAIFCVEVTEQRRLEAVVRHFRRPTPAASRGCSDLQSTTESPPDILSDRELQVLDLLAQGKSNKEVASALTISEKTVETYRSRIKFKLGLHSLVELVHYAIRYGIVKL
jgi:DNA-binding CsgD family transcriptional regulator